MQFLRHPPTVAYMQPPHDPPETGRQPVTLATRVRRARLAARMHQADLALAAGVNPATISRIENGTRGIAPQTLGKLADALGVTTAYLLGDDELAKARSAVA